MQILARCAMTEFEASRSLLMPRSGHGFTPLQRRARQGAHAKWTSAIRERQAGAAPLDGQGN